MESTRHGIAFDSNAVTHLLAAATEGFQPDGTDLAKQRVALMMLFLYLEPGVVPTVFQECQAMKDATKKKSHFGWIATQLHEFELDNTPEGISRRNALVRQLNALHPGEPDCRVVAEAEDQNFRYLVTCDEGLLKHLARQTAVYLEVEIGKPVDLWTQLAIEPGTSPRIVPHPTNPLSRQAWWRW